MRDTDKLLVNKGEPFMCEECVDMIETGDIYLEREYNMPSGDIIHSQYCKNCIPFKIDGRPSVESCDTKRVLLEYSCELIRFCNTLVTQFEIILSRQTITKDSIEYIRDIVDYKLKSTEGYKDYLLVQLKNMNQIC